VTPRRFVAKEIVEAMAWSGTVWAVGCKTRESALRAFDRRLARNLLVDEEGSVVVYDRKSRKLICWTSNITDPKLVARYWCR
jgi:hypothetical protein